MQTYMRVCPICAKENKRESYHSKFYVPGWSAVEEVNANVVLTDSQKEKLFTCKEHNQKMIQVSMTYKEFNLLCEISSEPSFMSAMNDLKQKDIIEYELKMSQFRTQVEQQKNLQNTHQQQESNVPKCPTCGSTNIRKISASRKMLGAIGFGLLSKTARSQWECSNCGNKW